MTTMTTMKNRLGPMVVYVLAQLPLGAWLPMPELIAQAYGVAVGEVTESQRTGGNHAIRTLMERGILERAHGPSNGSRGRPPVYVRLVFDGVEDFPGPQQE